MIKLTQLLESNNSYDRISKAWKKAYSNLPKKLGGHEHSAKLFQSIKKELEKEFHKDVFTDKQIQTALFGKKQKTGMDSWDYLDNIITKKMAKK